MTRTTPKRYYSDEEAARFGADGTNWAAMYGASLANIARGTTGPFAVEDARRMGELSGLTNRTIGSDIARATARARRPAKARARLQ